MHRTKLLIALAWLSLAASGAYAQTATGQITGTVKDPSGAVTSWELELGSPNTLIRYGWKRDSMKVGEEVIVEGYLARDGSKLVNAKTVKFSDGRVVNAGSSSGLDPTK